MFDALKVRLTVLLDGRPFDLRPGLLADELILTIWHDSRRHHIDHMLTRDYLAMSDDDLQTRLITPMIHCLDGAAYPERTKRFMAAVKEYARLHQAQYDRARTVTAAATANE